MNKKVSIASIVLCAISLTLLAILSIVELPLMTAIVTLLLTPITYITLYLILRRAGVSCRIIQPAFFTFWLVIAIINLIVYTYRYGIYLFSYQFIYSFFRYVMTLLPVIWFTVASYTGKNIKALHIICPLVLMAADTAIWLLEIASEWYDVSMVFYYTWAFVCSLLFEIGLMIFALKTGFINPFRKTSGPAPVAAPDKGGSAATQPVTMIPVTDNAGIAEQQAKPVVETGTTDRTVQDEPFEATEYEPTGDPVAATDHLRGVLDDSASPENDHADITGDPELHEAPMLDYTAREKKQSGQLGEIGYQSTLKEPGNGEHPVMDFGDPGDVLNDPVHDKNHLQTYQQYVEEANVPVLDQFKPNDTNKGAEA